MPSPDNRQQECNRERWESSVRCAASSSRGPTRPRARSSTSGPTRTSASGPSSRSSRTSWRSSSATAASRARSTPAGAPSTAPRSPSSASGGTLSKPEIYFVSRREFPTLPFGGVIDNVVDPETSLAVGLRVFGEYSLRVIEPQSLILNLVGTQNIQTNDQVTDWMREQLLKVLRTDVTSHIVQQNWPILGIAAHTYDLEQ